MNWPKRIISALDRVAMFSRWTNVVGLAAIFFMVAVTFVDVIMRYIVSRPIKGVLEITEVTMICAIFLAVAHTQNEKGHIGIDVVTSRLSPKTRTVVQFITTLLAVPLIATVIWQVFELTILFAQEQRYHSLHMLIPCAPFAAVVMLGCTCLCLLLIRDLLRIVLDGLGLGLGWRHWVVGIGVPILFTVFATLWVQPTLWQLEQGLVAMIGIGFSILLLFTGMPVAFVLVLTGLLFIGHIRGPDAAVSLLAGDIYRNAGSYSWSVVPFFVLLGYLCFFARFGEDLYYAAYRWLGHIRGGLSAATIGACTAFAAIVGDPLAATATMGAVALPQMRKYKYDDRLSAGSIIGGATLGPIIPPSVPFIIYGLLTGLSIGKLFVAGIFPGLLLSALSILTVFIWCRLNPNAGPAGERSMWKARVASLKAGGPVAILFVLVIGGIYLGAFSPTEGGAIGASVAVLIGLVYRRWTWANFSQAFLEAGKVIAMVFLILIGAVQFSRFMAWCNLSGMILEGITALGLSPILVMLLILTIYFVLGWFIDILPLLLIFVPILHPVAIFSGLDPIWVAVLSVMMISIGDVTPPIGVVLYTLKAISKDLPLPTIFVGVLPFVLAGLLAIAIIFVVPPIATWLPNLMK